MVHYLFPTPQPGESTLQFPAEELPGKTGMMVYPLKPWTWKEDSVMQQIQDLSKPKLSAPIAPDDPPPEPEFFVHPTPYQTGFKSGGLMKLNFPSSMAQWNSEKAKAAELAERMKHEPPTVLTLQPSATQGIHISSFI